MRKRIYTDNGCDCENPDVKKFTELLMKSAREASTFAVEHNLDLRDALSYSQGIIHTSFAGAILRSYKKETE
jgi:hypothetical protein